VRGFLSSLSQRLPSGLSQMAEEQRVFIEAARLLREAVDQVIERSDASAELVSAVLRVLRDFSARDSALPAWPAGVQDRPSGKAAPSYVASSTDPAAAAMTAAPAGSRAAEGAAAKSVLGHAPSVWCAVPAGSTGAPGRRGPYPEDKRAVRRSPFDTWDATFGKAPPGSSCRVDKLVIWTQPAAGDSAKAVFLGIQARIPPPRARVVAAAQL